MPKFYNDNFYTKNYKIFLSNSKFFHLTVLLYLYEVALVLPIISAFKLNYT